MIYFLYPKIRLCAQPCTVSASFKTISRLEDFELIYHYDIDYYTCFSNLSDYETEMKEFISKIKQYFRNNCLESSPYKIDELVKNINDLKNIKVVSRKLKNLI